MITTVIGEDDYLEVFVECSFEECARRDVKGLYKKALNGEIKNFTGLDAPFEAPKNPWLKVNTERESLEESLSTVYNKVVDKIRYQA